MKMSILVLSALSVLLFTSPALQAQEEARATPAESAKVDQLFQPLVDALKTGNIALLKTLLSEKMYRKHRVLLEENKEYSAFLARYYEEAEIELEDTFRKGDELEARVRITFPDGEVSVLTLRVEDDGSGSLRIK